MHTIHSFILGALKVEVQGFHTYLGLSFMNSVPSPILGALLRSTFKLPSALPKPTSMHLSFHMDPHPGLRRLVGAASEDSELSHGFTHGSLGNV